MNLLQTKLKAVVAFASALVTSLVVLYQQNQNLTLKQAVSALVAGVVTGVVVHQAPNKK